MQKQNVRLVKNLSIQTFSNVSVKIDSRYFTINQVGFPNQININQCPIIRISDGKKVLENIIHQRILLHIKYYTNPFNKLKVFHIHTQNMPLRGPSLENQFQFMEQLTQITGLEKFQSLVILNKRNLKSTKKILAT